MIFHTIIVQFANLANSIIQAVYRTVCIRLLKTDLLVTDPNLRAVIRRRSESALNLQNCCEKIAYVALIPLASFQLPEDQATLSILIPPIPPYKTKAFYGYRESTK